MSNGELFEITRSVLLPSKVARLGRPLLDFFGDKPSRSPFPVYAVKPNYGLYGEFTPEVTQVIEEFGKLGKQFNQDRLPDEALVTVTASDNRFLIPHRDPNYDTRTVFVLGENPSTIEVEGEPHTLEPGDVYRLDNRRSPPERLLHGVLPGAAGRVAVTLSYLEQS